MTYYNTTDLNGEELRTRIALAKTQDEKLMTWFCNYPDLKFTRDEVHRSALPAAPVASVVRALNTLMKQREIIKLKEFRMGSMNHRQHLWQLYPRYEREPEQRNLL